MPRGHFFQIEAWTNRFLGTAMRAQSLLVFLETMDAGRWVPELWNTIEPIRNPFSKSAGDQIVRRWIEDRPTGSGRVWNYLMFRRKKPSALVMAQALRFGAPQLNSIWIELEAMPFATEDGPSRLKAILLGCVSWCDAVYGCVFYSAQSHKRIAQMTPLQRLKQAYWLNFFGRPYLDMFGREKVLQAPCHSVEEVKEGGVYLQAAPRFDSPEITDSDKLLLSLEEYLGPDAFAGRGYPKTPCRVPSFGLSETTLSRAR